MIRTRIDSLPADTRILATGDDEGCPTFTLHADTSGGLFLEVESYNAGCDCGGCETHLISRITDVDSLPGAPFTTSRYGCAAAAHEALLASILHADVAVVA